MPKITYIDQDGGSRVVDAPVGDSVMESAVDNDVDGIVAACGGNCSCSTCHVYIDEAWVKAVGPRHEEEEFTLEYGIDVRPTSRLSCQIEVTDELDGLVVHLPAEQAELSDRPSDERRPQREEHAMTLELTFLGHSGFLMSDGEHTLAIDPFLTGNPVATMAASDVKCDAVALTHGHADHFGDTLAIAQANDANVIAAFEMCNYLQEQGHDNVNPGNPGGRIDTGFGWVAFTHAFHSSSFEGQYMGMPCGLVVHMGGKTVYHCGDTGLFGDMKLIGEIYRPDAACVPIGDRFTMGPELATKAAELIGAPVAIPIHYDTWPPIAQDPADFAPAGVEVKVMAPGDTLAI